jgi:hypothetical protein
MGQKPFELAQAKKKKKWVIPISTQKIRPCCVRLSSQLQVGIGSITRRIKICVEPNKKHETLSEK